MTTTMTPEQYVALHGCGYQPLMLDRATTLMADGARIRNNGYETVYLDPPDGAECWRLRHQFHRTRLDQITAALSVLERVMGFEGLNEVTNANVIAPPRFTWDVGNFGPPPTDRATGKLDPKRALLRLEVRASRHRKELAELEDNPPAGGLPEWYGVTSQANA